MIDLKQKGWLLLALIMILSLDGTMHAQQVDNDYQSRLSATLSFDLTKELKLNITPELRFDEDFFLNKSLLETELSYKPFKFLSFNSAYRFVINNRDKKETEYQHRIALGATVKKKIMRFTPGFKLSYSNYADDGVSDKEYLRYKGFLKYDITNCKITPYIGIEAYRELKGFDLYKVRYQAGADYKLLKNNYIGLSYKFDYYLNEYTNRHIISIAYKIKF